jgi:signal transduction histidine kinase/CHASE1-domain containing sensor protein
MSAVTAGRDPPSSEHGRSKRATTGVRSGLALGTLVLVVGLIVSAGTSIAVRRVENTRAIEALEQRSQLVVRAVEVEAGRYVETLRNLAAATGAYENLTASKFAENAVQRREMRLAGASSVAFMVPTTDDEISSTQEFWRDRGATDLALQPVGNGEHLFSIFSEPLDGSTARRAGIDASAAPAAAQALHEARRTGQVTVSDTYRLLLDRDLPIERQQLSFIITAPVRGPVDEHGQRSFKGWVLMGLRGQDLIAETLIRTAQEEVDVALLARNSDGATVQVAGLRMHGNSERDLHHQVDATVAQRAWELQFDAVGADLPGHSQLPDALLAGGALLSLLLGSLVGLLATDKARAEARVDDATAGLRATKAELRQDKERSESIAAVAATVAESGIRTPAIADTITKELAARVGDQSGFAVYDRDTGLFHQIASAGRDPDVEEASNQALRSSPPHIDGQTHLAQAARGGATVVVDVVDPLAFAESLPEPFRTFVLAHPLHHLMAVPFRYDGALLGVITVARFRPGPFDQRDIDLVEDIAQRAAVAVANARLYEQTAAAEQAVRLTQADLERANAELAQINADLDRFAATAAHDLRSPLHRISGFTQLLALEYGDTFDDNARDYLAHIDDSARHLADLTSDLLTLARITDEAMVLEEVSLSETAQIVLENLQTVIAEADAAIAIDPLPTVLGDHGLLERLLQNLIANAIKYQPPGQKPQIHVTAHPDGELNVTVLDIVDNGIGIDPEHVDAVFQPFRRLHANTYSGTGLGLAVCARITQRHGGQIEARPNLDRGTTFSVTLLLATATATTSLHLATADTP